MDLKELLGEELYQQVIDKAGDEHKVAVVSDGNWFPKEKFDAKNQEAKSLQDQLSERDTQLEELRGKANGNEELQATIDSLKEANTQAKESYEQQLRDQKLNYELDRELLTAKARNPVAVRALLDTEVIKLDEDGKIKGLSEQLEGLKESDSYLFSSDNSDGSVGSGHYKPGAPKKTNGKTDDKDLYAQAQEHFKNKFKK